MMKLFIENSIRKILSLLFPNKVKQFYFLELRAKSKSEKRQDNFNYSYRKIVTMHTKCLAICFFIVLALFLASPAFSHPAFDIKDGLKALEAGDLDKAESLLHKARFEEPDNYIVNYDLGIVSYRKRDYAKSVRFFARASELCKTPEERFNTFYNMGNAAFKGYDFELAVTAYKNALTVKNDYKAEYNLKVAEEKLKEMLERQKKEQEQQQEQQQPDQQKQQQGNQKEKQEKNNKDFQKQGENQEKDNQNQQQQQGDKQDNQQNQENNQNQQLDNKQNSKNSESDNNSGEGQQQNAEQKDETDNKEKQESSSGESKEDSTKENQQNSEQSNNESKEQKDSQSANSQENKDNQASNQDNKDSNGEKKDEDNSLTNAEKSAPEEDRRDIQMAEDKGKVSRPEASQKARAMKNMRLNKKDVEEYLKQMEARENENQKYYRINNIEERDPAYMNQDELKEWLKIRNRKKERARNNEQDW